MKKTILMLSAAVLLLIVVLGIYKIRELMADRTGYVFDGDRIPEIESLRVMYQGDTVDMVRKGPKWVMARDGFPVDPKRIANALHNLMSIRSNEKVSESGDETRLAEFGLNALEAKRVEWTLSSGEKEHVLLGKTSGADNSSTYWKWDGKPGVYRTLGNFNFDLASIEDEWKDHHFLPDFLYENVQTIAADWRDSLGVMQHYKMERTSDTSVKLIEPFVAPVPRTTAGAIFEQAPQFTIDAFVAPGDLNVHDVRLDAPYVLLQIGMKDGKTYEVRSGGEFDGFHYVRHPSFDGIVRIAKWRFDFFRKTAADIVNPALAPKGRLQAEE